MRVLFLTKYTSRGPSSRYRVHQFLPYLRAAGIDADIQALHDDDYLVRRFAGRRPSPAYLLGRFARRLWRLSAVKHYHVVFIQKELFPYLPGAVEAVLARMGVKTILDIDDAIYLFYERATGWKRRLLAGKIPGVMRRADAVLAGNRHLFSYARRHTERAVLFPTVVDDERFAPRGRQPNRIPVVGWIGSPETVGFLHDLAPALREAGTPFELSVVGAPDTRIEGVNVSAKVWREDEEVGDLCAMDVGVMPLRDDDWARGKCSLKLLQYMSCGVATVSTPSGSVPDIVDDGENGLLARTPEQWRAAVTRLLDDAALRARVGANARRWVEQHYSLRNYGPRLVEIVAAVAAGREVGDGSTGPALGTGGR